MIDSKDIARMAAHLSATLVADTTELIASGKSIEDLTPEETEATIAVLLGTVGAIQSYVISALPPDKAANVRAYLDRLSNDIQHARNVQAPTPTPLIMPGGNNAELP